LPIQHLLRGWIGARYCVYLINAGLSPKLLYYFTRHYNLFGLELSKTCEYSTFLCYAQLQHVPISEAVELDDGTLFIEPEKLQRMHPATSRFVGPRGKRTPVAVSRVVARTLLNALPACQLVQSTVQFW